jgi:hypothetical protein
MSIVAKLFVIHEFERFSQDAESWLSALRPLRVTEQHQD